MNELENALKDSKKHKRIIKAKLAVFSVAIDRIDTQIGDKKTKIENQGSVGKLGVALLLTGLSIIKVGWLPSYTSHRLHTRTHGPKISRQERSGERSSRQN